MKVKIELLKPHTDAGIEYQPGDTLELFEDQAKWLEQESVCKIIAKAKPAADNAA